MNFKLPLFALFATLSASPPALAQEVTNLPAHTDQSIGVEAGLDSALIARATYSHRLPALLSGALVYARFTLPFAEPDLKDFAVDAGVRASLLSAGNWKLELLLGPELRKTSNRLFSATAFGVRSAALGGYESDTWGALAEVGFDQVLTTHIAHSDLYRRVGYSDAKDGWYATTGGTWHAGVRGGARFDRLELSVAAGVMTSAQFNALVPPFYGTLGGSYAF